MAPVPPWPEIIDPPPLDRASLDALLSGSRYFDVAGCGPTMPIARGAMEAFGRWLDSVAMFSHVGFAAYDSALAETRRRPRHSSATRVALRVSRCCRARPPR